LVTDNDDPDELGRVQVKFVTMHEEPLSFWLRQASPNAGEERGLYSTPEVDDEVLVLFINGSQDIGVIVGQFWNGVDKPPKEAVNGLASQSRNLWKGDWSKDEFKEGSSDDADNDRRFWRSRSGHIFGFDDTAGEETVQMWDKSGELALIFDTADSRIILSNNKGDIHIRAKKDLYLEAGKNAKFKVGKDYTFEAGMNGKVKYGQNYTFEAGMDAKHKAGMNYEMKAGIDFKGKGGVNATIEGGVAFTGKGGISGDLKGGVSASVKAAIVQIN
ncbi:MAG: phage baseplate assembly protein V, partial [Myxococcota bacterium]